MGVPFQVCGAVRLKRIRTHHAVFGVRDKPREHHRNARKSGNECLGEFFPCRDRVKASAFRRCLDGSTCNAVFVRILLIFVSPCVLYAVHTRHTCERTETCSSLQRNRRGNTEIDVQKVRPNPQQDIHKWSGGIQQTSFCVQGSTLFDCVVTT